MSKNDYSNTRDTRQKENRTMSDSDILMGDDFQPVSAKRTIYQERTRTALRGTQARSLVQRSNSFNSEKHQHEHHDLSSYTEETLNQYGRLSPDISTLQPTSSSPVRMATQLPPNIQYGASSYVDDYDSLQEAPRTYQPFFGHPNSANSFTADEFTPASRPSTSQIVPQSSAAGSVVFNRSAASHYGAPLSQRHPLQANPDFYHGVFAGNSAPNATGKYSLIQLNPAYQVQNEMHRHDDGVIIRPPLPPAPSFTVDGLHHTVTDRAALAAASSAMQLSITNPKKQSMFNTVQQAAAAEKVKERLVSTVSNEPQTKAPAAEQTEEIRLDSAVITNGFKEYKFADRDNYNAALTILQQNGITKPDKSTAKLTVYVSDKDASTMEKYDKLFVSTQAVAKPVPPANGGSSLMASLSVASVEPAVTGISTVQTLSEVPLESSLALAPEKGHSSTNSSESVSSKKGPNVRSSVSTVSPRIRFTAKEVGETILNVAREMNITLSKKNGMFSSMPLTTPQEVVSNLKIGEGKDGYYSAPDQIILETKLQTMGVPSNHANSMSSSVLTRLNDLDHQVSAAKPASATQHHAVEHKADSVEPEVSKRPGLVRGFGFTQPTAVQPAQSSKGFTKEAIVKALNEAAEMKGVKIPYKNSLGSMVGGLGGLGVALTKVGISKEAGYIEPTKEQLKNALDNTVGVPIAHTDFIAGKAMEILTKSRAQYETAADLLDLAAPHSDEPPLVSSASTAWQAQVSSSNTAAAAQITIAPPRGDNTSSLRIAPKAGHIAFETFVGIMQEQLTTDSRESISESLKAEFFPANQPKAVVLDQEQIITFMGKALGVDTPALPAAGRAALEETAEIKGASAFSHLREHAQIQATGHHK